MEKQGPAPQEVEVFLSDHGVESRDLLLLKGGAWSTAYRFVSNDEAFVVRFGKHPEDYERDRVAGTWHLLNAPTPEVFEIGDAFDGSFAISTWHEGDKFDELTGERAARATRSLLRAYEDVATIDLPGVGFGIWEGRSGDAPFATWPEYLVATPDLDDDRMRGWRERLQKHRETHAVFMEAQRIVERLAPQCVSERRVTHGDPLNANVLIDASGNVSALLDWGVSVVGDPLYELAMLMLCEPWMPALQRSLVRADALRRNPNLEARDVDVRLHASLLHGGLGMLQYQAFAELTEFLAPSTEVVKRFTAEAHEFL